MDQEQRLALSRAVEHEHPCTDNSCDIAKAMDIDAPVWAAHLLMGATECPRTDAAWSFANPIEEEIEAECKLLLRERHVTCVKCGAVVWLDEDTDCDNCGGAVKARENED